MPTLRVEDFSVEDQRAIARWLERNGEGGLVSAAHPIRLCGPVALYWRLPCDPPGWRFVRGRVVFLPVLRWVKGWWS